VTLPAALLDDPGNAEVWLTHYAKLAALAEVEQALSSYSPAMSGLVPSFGAGTGGGGGGGIMPLAHPRCTVTDDVEADAERRGDTDGPMLTADDAMQDCRRAGGWLFGSAFGAGVTCTLCVSTLLTYGLTLPSCTGCITLMLGTRWAARHASVHCRRALQQAN
jgi:hypothetical protein